MPCWPSSPVAGIFVRDVELPVGRVHYGNCRIVGYGGTSFARCLDRIPASGELRPGDHAYIVGAGGPMGVMATIRSISSGIEGISVSGSNRNADRLAALAQRAEPTAEKYGVNLDLFDPRERGPQEWRRLFLHQRSGSGLGPGRGRECQSGRDHQYLRRYPSYRFGCH